MKGSKLARHIFLSIFAAMWFAPVYLMFINALADTDDYLENFDWSYKGFEPAANFKSACEAADLTPGLISNAIYGISKSITFVTFHFLFIPYWPWVATTVEDCI